MAINVFRGAGGKKGAPVVCPKLSEAVLVDYGRHLMNQQAHQKTSIQASVAYRSDLALGDLVRLQTPDNANGAVAKLTGISFTLQHGQATQTINLEKPL